ncbi:MAG: hypothetical protein D6711_18625 [Chloroflexi bacterium]|nr:MAG: hypothetical protein D6711_18625 [Chloroflexota bacterium]
MHLLLVFLMAVFIRADETDSWLAWFDTEAEVWLATPLNDITAEPRMLDYPPYPLLWSETGIAYVDDMQNLVIEIDKEVSYLLEDADVWGQAWSHDGRFFAYAYTMGEVHQLAVYDLATDEIIPLLDPLTMWSAYIELRWSPDDSILAARLAEPPMPETVLMINTACLRDEDASCSSSRLYDPAEDESSGVSLPIWRDDAILYGCSGRLCILDDHELQVDDMDSGVGRFLGAVSISFDGNFALIKTPQAYHLVDASGTVIAEYPLEAMPFFLKVSPQSSDIYALVQESQDQVRLLSVGADGVREVQSLLLTDFADCDVVNPCGISDFRVTPDGLLVVGYFNGMNSIYRIQDETVQLVERAVWNEGIALSPDKSSLAYVVREADDRFSIYVNDGQNRSVPLTETSPQRQFRPVWDPQNEWILFFTIELEDSKEVTNQIYRVAPDGGAAAYVRDGLLPVWSPDGEWIAYCSGTRTDSTVFIMDRDGENPRQLTTEPQMCYDLL